MQTQSCCVMISAVCVVYVCVCLSLALAGCQRPCTLYALNMYICIHTNMYKRVRVRFVYTNISIAFLSWINLSKLINQWTRVRASSPRAAKKSRNVCIHNITLALPFGPRDARKLMMMLCVYDAVLCWCVCFMYAFIHVKSECGTTCVLR